jgi:hypothetical protein
MKKKIVINTIDGVLCFFFIMLVLTTPVSDEWKYTRNAYIIL